MSNWQYVSPLAAYQAFVAGAHDIEQQYSRASANEPWTLNNGYFAQGWSFRIREKGIT